MGLHRFQAHTNTVLAAQLERLRQRLGLERSQNGVLLREVASLAAWVLDQAERGREIQARDQRRVVVLVHPVLERIRARKARTFAGGVQLSDREAQRLQAVLERSSIPPVGIRAAVATLAKPRRHPPKLRWRKTVVA
jgi:hypothetical protein